MLRYFRYVMFLICAVQLFFAFAFMFQMPIAVEVWPLPNTGPMALIFIGSFFAAAAASTLWCVTAREYGALTGVALDYMVIFIPLTILAFQLDATLEGSQLAVFGVACAVGAAFGIGLFLWSSRIPIADTRPMPTLVRGSFIAFTIALVLVGVLLISKTPNVLPWPVTPDNSVVYGWMFLGAAVYFLYGVLRPSWHNAAGQLAGFLAYDLVLIVPFLTRLPTIDDELRLSLIFYTIVVTYSGLLAIYYLFINPETQIWRGQRQLSAA